MGYWTPNELEYVRDHFQSQEYAQIADALGRTTSAVRNICYVHKWRKKEPLWTEAEIETLRGYYKSSRLVRMSELVALLPGRPRTSICKKAGDEGLTNRRRKAGEEERALISAKATERIRTLGHPRGYLGHKHTAEAKEKMLAATRRAWADPSSGLNSEKVRQGRSDLMKERHESMGEMRTGYSRGKMGKREDLNGLYVRSSWEANYARYLNWLVSIGQIARWEYEPDTFEFTAIKRGTRSYTPDFKVYENDGRVAYHEVKGWMDQPSRTRLERMARYYPDVQIVLIDAPVYRALARDVRRLIANWEGDA